MNDIVIVAERLIPLIHEHRHATERRRCIADPIVRAIRESDLCRMLLDTGRPPRYTPEEWLHVLGMLARAEASVAWIVWNNTLPCFWARFLDDAARERIFGDPNRLFAGSTRRRQAVATEGGFRLSGRWSLVSGCELADYVHLMSLVHENGVPRMHALVSPMSAGASCPRATTQSSTPGMPGGYGAPGVMTSLWMMCSCHRRHVRTFAARGGKQVGATPHSSRDDGGSWCAVPGHGARGD